MELPKADMKKLSKDAQTIIGRLLSASKNLKLYPASHPISKRIITASFTKLDEVLKEYDFLSFSLAGNVLLLNDKPAQIFNKQTIDAFLTALGKRKIGKLTFIRGVDLDEFRSLIELLGIEPEDIEKQGGLDTVVARKNVRNISVSGLSFGETQEVKETGMKWKDLLALIAGSDDFVKRIGENPEQFSQTVGDSLKGEATGHGFGGKVKEAVGNIAERLFNMYEKTDIETYTDAISRLILVLTPEMQSELIFTKPEIPFWDDVVNKVVDKIAATELGDLIAKETKKQYETVATEGRGKGIGGGLGDGIGTGIEKGKKTGLGPGRGGGIGTELDSGRGKGIGGGLGDGIGKGTGTGKGTGLGPGRGKGIGGGLGDGIGTGIEEEKGKRMGLGPGRGGGTGKRHLSNINAFLRQFIEKNKRKDELIPAIKKSLEKEGVKEPVFDSFSGGVARKEFLKVIESDLIKTDIDEESLIGIRNLIKKNADIEELLKFIIDMLNNKDTEIRIKAVISFVDLTEKLLLLGRIDLLKLIMVAFSERLGKEPENRVFETIVDALSRIAVRLIKEGKGLLAELIDDVLNNYLKSLEDTDKLNAVITTLSKIGDAGDQKALQYLSYAINRDVAYKKISAELIKKREKILPLLLHSMKTIEDKLTRIRMLSLIIDTIKKVPNFEKFISTYIDDPKWYVRRNIAIILGETEGEKAFKLLSKLVNDKKTKVRIEVMESLGKIKTEDSELLLIEGLKDTDRNVVIQTLTSLKKIGTEMAVFALRELLEKPSFLKTEKLIEIQERTIAVLRKIGGRDVVDILRKVIFDKTILGRYKYDDKIRLLSVDALGKMESKISKQILTRVTWLKNQKVGERATEILKTKTLL